MSDKPKDIKVGCGCPITGCLPLILGIFTLWALFFGLPTPWGKVNIDLFPPAIKIVE